jgi:deoxyribonuclease-4
MASTYIPDIYVGAHINREKTIIKTMDAITKNGGNCLQLFVSNPRSSSIGSLDNYISIADDIKGYTAIHGFKTVIHSSYTINLARDFKNGKRAVPINECHWIQLLIHELTISHLIDSVGVVVHVGKHTTQSPEYGLENMRIAIAYVIETLQKGQINAKIILETPAGQGTELLPNLNDFLAFYNGFSSDQQKYLGICLDTAHIWAAGYDICEAYQTICNKNASDLIVVHLNNSKVAKGSNVDRHATLFDPSGTIPYSSIKKFIELCNEKKRSGNGNSNSNSNSSLIILETPSHQYEDEIALIKLLG